MREIKFRAWVDNEIIEGRSSQMYDVLNYCWKPSGDTVDLWFNLMPIKTMETKWLELMQYTGLKDKNGKEIYEGDIVVYRVGDINLRGTIGWCEFNCCFALNAETDDETYHTIHPPFSNCYEVIGNIYENPELLEAKDA